MLKGVKVWEMQERAQQRNETETAKMKALGLDKTVAAAERTFEAVEPPFGAERLRAPGMQEGATETMFELRPLGPAVRTTMARWI